MFKIFIIIIFVLSLHASEDMLKVFKLIQEQEKNQIVQNFKQEQYLILNIRKKTHFHKKHKKNKHSGGLQYHKNMKNDNNQHGKNK